LLNDKIDHVSKVVELFSSAELTEQYMLRVINEWKYSCEHNLTNPKTNKTMYLCQAACFLYANVYPNNTFKYWRIVPKEYKKQVNEVVEKIIKIWQSTL
jgi:hypothetical protein